MDGFFWVLKNLEMFEIATTFSFSYIYDQQTHELLL